MNGGTLTDGRDAMPERCETCADCFFSMRDMIPDPNALHEIGKAKPRIAGYRCHVSRPGTNGFPIVRADEFCTFFTDRRTRNRPFIKYIRQDECEV